MNRRQLASLLALTGIMATSHAASAAEDGGDPRAKEAFQLGLDLMKSGRTAQACAMFAEAHRIEPRTGYVVNLARCEAKLGQLVAANRHWQDAAALASSTNDDRKPEVERGLEASTRELPRIVLDVPAAEGIAVAIDQRPVTEDAARRGVPVDFGAHHVVVTQQGRTVHDSTVRITTLGELASVYVSPTLLRAPTESKPAPAMVIVPNVAGDPHRGETLRMVGIGSIGAGLALAGIGTYATLRAGSLNSESRDDCNGNVCGDAGLAARNRAQASADLATVAFIGSGALAAAGVVLYLVAPRASAPSTSPRAYVTPGLGGASLSGSF